MTAQTSPAGDTSQPRTPQVHEQHGGRWRASVPLPFYGFLHVRCHCGERFWNWRGGKRRSWGTPLEVYQWHYRREHIPTPDAAAAGGDDPR